MANADHPTCQRCGVPLPADNSAGLCLRCHRSDTAEEKTEIPRVRRSSPGQAHRKRALASAVAAVGVILLVGLWFGDRQGWQAADVAALLNRSVSLHRRGKLDESIAVYREVIRRQPDAAEAHYNLGIVLQAQGKLDEAIAAYREGIRLKPDNAYAHVNLGTALQDQGKLEEAVAAFRDVIRIRPDLAEAHNNLGDVLQAQGKLDEAITEFRTAIRLQPDDADAYSNLGNALATQGKLAEAINAFRAVIRLQPTGSKAHGNLGHALQAQGKLDEAIAAYRAAIGLNPDDAAAHYNLGVALVDRGRQDEAVAELRTATRLNPDDAEGHNSLTLALVLSAARPQRDYDEGLLHARKAVALAPNGYTYGTLALAEYRSKRWTESLAASERSMALTNGGDASHWFILALAQWQNGDKDQARRWFDKAVAWTAENAPTDAVLRPFWAEAAELLGQPGPDAAGAGSSTTPRVAKPG